MNYELVLRNNCLCSISCRNSFVTVSIDELLSKMIEYFVVPKRKITTRREREILKNMRRYFEIRVRLGRFIQQELVHMCTMECHKGSARPIGVVGFSMSDPIGTNSNHVMIFKITMEKDVHRRRRNTSNNKRIP